MSEDWMKEAIETQCDNMATGTQMREFLRDGEGNEPLLREMLRLNLEQFARTIARHAPAHKDESGLREALGLVTIYQVEGDTRIFLRIAGVPVTNFDADTPEAIALLKLDAAQRASASEKIKAPLPAWLGPDTPELRERLQAFIMPKDLRGALLEAREYISGSHDHDSSEVIARINVALSVSGVSGETSSAENAQPSTSDLAGEKGAKVEFVMVPENMSFDLASVAGDRTVIVLPKAEYDSFFAALSESAKPNEKLRELLHAATQPAPSVPLEIRKALERLGLAFDRAQGACVQGGKINRFELQFADMDDAREFREALTAARQAPVAGETSSSS